jgi:shikimate kinase
MPPRVYLTGFMGSGKSTVGPLVADRLGYRFVDLDWMIEAREGRTVSNLFAEGEAVFRAAEAEALAESTRGDGLVVATGGGTLLAPANLHRARSAGVVVWLRATPEVTVRRLADASGRPLLADARGVPLQGPALEGRIRTLMAAREPGYARADLTVGAQGPPDVVAREVVQAVRNWQRD